MAVGMKRALESAIGLPSRSTRASRMLPFLIPADVRSALMFLPSRVGNAVEMRLHSSASFVQASHVHKLDVPRALRLGDQLGVEACPAEEEEPGRRLAHDSSNVTQAFQLTEPYRF